MAALSDPKLPEVVELSHLDVSEFDALFGEEIAIWDNKFHWDFRPSADLLRRFLLVRSLIGYALRIGRSVVGYTYCVCEGRIPLASTIDHRQSSSGPGLIPIFSWNAVVLKGFASALR